MNKSPLLISCLLILTGIAIAHPTSQPSTLDNIEKRVDNAVKHYFITSKTDSIMSIISGLEKMKLTNAQAHYWIAFVYYQLSTTIYYNDNELSENAINKGIELLDEIHDKNAEVYALSILSKSYALKFANFITIAFKSTTVKRECEAVIKLYTYNPRVNLSVGIYDYYTPVKYGGKKKAEQYFLKALTLPWHNDKNLQIPSWGKDMAYFYLASYYLDTKQNSKAKNILIAGRKEFPNSYMLLKLSNSNKN